ncbi:hypothetical protein AC578_4234 [Pseudocercospora eumusae]|uniref:Uncharacterized protein n=1 Tax=Pseudocercospora eumusae TaxID=321146 RepID=A0A139H3I6_9PEZI|nr:hypothetical protein AC578_4234 [Pseudocercospora eumusae]
MDDKATDMWESLRRDMQKAEANKATKRRSSTTTDMPPSRLNSMNLLVNTLEDLLCSLATKTTKEANKSLAIRDPAIGDDTTTCDPRMALGTSTSMQLTSNTAKVDGMNEILEALRKDLGRLTARESQEQLRLHSMRDILRNAVLTDSLEWKFANLRQE